MLSVQGLDWYARGPRRIAQTGLVGFLFIGLLLKIPLLREIAQGSEHTFTLGSDDIRSIEQIKALSRKEPQSVALLAYDGFIKFAVMDAVFLDVRHYVATAYQYLGPYQWEIVGRLPTDPPDLLIRRKAADIIEETTGDILHDSRHWRVVRLKNAVTPKHFLVGPAWNAPLELSPGTQFRWLRGTGLVGLWLPTGGSCDLGLDIAPERNRAGCRLKVSANGIERESILLRSEPMREPFVLSTRVRIQLHKGFNWIALTPEKLPEDKINGLPWVMVTKVHPQLHFE